MTVKLSQPDFNRLTRIVQNLPDFANVRDRSFRLPQQVSYTSPMGITHIKG